MDLKKIECIDEIKQGDWVYMVGNSDNDFKNYLVQFECIDNGKYGYRHLSGKTVLRSSDALLCHYNLFYKVEK